MKTRKIEFDITGATAKTCGTCPHLLISVCMLFRGMQSHGVALDWAPGGRFKRLPICIAAEVKRAT